jgi:hypothetical protein
MRVVGTLVESGREVVVESFGNAKLLSEDFGGVDVRKLLWVGQCESTLEVVDRSQDDTWRMSVGLGSGGREQAGTLEVVRHRHGGADFGSFGLSKNEFELSMWNVDRRTCMQDSGQYSCTACIQGFLTNDYA